MKFNNLWVEKYRPAKLEDIVLTDSVRKTIQKYVSDKTIPNLLFIGNAGIGKTSLAKIIVKAELQ